MKEYTVKVFENRIEWYNQEGQLHRDEGPAIEYTNGDKHWYKNGLSHRDDGPAVEWSNGHREWHKNDRLHRDDGPACEYPDGTKFWFLNGKEYSEEEYHKEAAKQASCQDKIIEIDSKKYKLVEAE